MGVGLGEDGEGKGKFEVQCIKFSKEPNRNTEEKTHPCIPVPFLGATQRAGEPG